MLSYALAIGYALFLWWFSTGVILYLNGRVMSDLRLELEAARSQARALQRPAKPNA